MNELLPTRWRFSLLVGMVVSLLAPGGWAKPNVLVIITDQQSADAMSSVQGPQYLRTPHMDSLARRGVTFTRAYCANPICVPSRTSMLTGRYPTETGILSNRKAPFEASAWPTIGTLFKAAGYATGYVGKWHLPYPVTDPASGFEYTANNRNNGADAATPAAVADFLQTKREQPFLLFASFVNPHNICEWPRGQRLPDGEIGPLPPPADCPPAPANLAAQQDEPEAMNQLRKLYQATPQFPVGSFDADRWRQYRWAYYRMIEKTDGRIGEILEALRQTGHDNDTIVVFTSDHGDCQGAHGWNQKTVFFEESSRVPFIVVTPGSRGAGRQVRQLVQTGIDLLPTLLDLADIAPPPTLPGCSLRAAAEGRSPAGPRPYVVVSNVFAEGQKPPGLSVTPSGRMLRTDRYKYCVYNFGQPRESLVDLESDPGELKNLANDPAAASLLSEHRALLRAWSQATGDREFPYLSAQTTD